MLFIYFGAQTWPLWRRNPCGPAPTAQSCGSLAGGTCPGLRVGVCYVLSPHCALCRAVVSVVSALCQSQPALSFPFVQSVFGILLFMIRIVPAAAVCSFLFPLKHEMRRGSVFLDIQLKSPFIPLSLSASMLMVFVCLSGAVIPCSSSFSLKLSLWWLCSRVRQSVRGSSVCSDSSPMYGLGWVFLKVFLLFLLVIKTPYTLISSILNRVTFVENTCWP